MAKPNWKNIRDFSLDEIKEPIQGKWVSLYCLVFDRLLELELPQGTAIEFDSLQEAKRAAVGLTKQFKLLHGPRTIRTSVRVHNNRPCLLVWRGANWTGEEN